MILGLGVGPQTLPNGNGSFTALGGTASAPTDDFLTFGPRICGADATILHPEQRQLQRLRQQA